MDAAKGMGEIRNREGAGICFTWVQNTKTGITEIKYKKNHWVRHLVFIQLPVGNV
jgi:hypothetical protein